MQELRFLYYYKELIKRRKNLIENFEMINAVLQSELFNDIFQPPITYKEFLWGYNVISTRTFLYEVDEAKQALIPFIELANHGNLFSDTGFVYNSYEKLFEMRATKSYLPGEEIFVSYGLDKESDILLLQYGFVPENNIPLCFKLYINIPSNDPYMREKLK